MTRRELLVGGNRLEAGPRRLAADVQDGGAGPDQRMRLRNGLVRRPEAAAVGKGIRRDVQDAHHLRSPAGVRHQGIEPRLSVHVHAWVPANFCPAGPLLTAVGAAYTRANGPD